MGGSVFRLRGEVRGAERVFALPRGTVTLGRGPGHELVLPVPGVSRDHAELAVTAGGVEVRDLESKNGSRVNGRRVEQQALTPGDELGFGPVLLTLEAVEEGDAVLALRLEPDVAPPLAPDAVVSGSTPLLAAGEGVARWLPLLDELTIALTAQPPDLSAALAALCRGVGARGACLAEAGGGGEATVLSAWGRLDGLWDTAGAGALSGGCPAGGELEVVPTGSAELPMVARLGLERGCLVLALWEATGGHPVLPGIGLVLRLLAGFTGRTTPPPREESPPGTSPTLVFPPGYVPCGSSAIAALHDGMRTVAATDLPVLIHGESGVGKEMVARTLHLSSPRAAGPRVGINCAALPAELVEAEMFGVGKGVATGVEARPGRFLEADGGTLFLDEVGEMPPELQAKLLRALEEQEIQPLGRPAVRVDVRVVAATNADLRQRVADGRFRQDLYFRLAGAVLEVPPLRRRRQDVPVLLEHFLRRAADAAGKSVRGVTRTALERLTAYSWPGNVRELSHVVRFLVHRVPAGGAVDLALLPPEIAAADPGAAVWSRVEDCSSLRLADHVEPLERRLIAEALGRTGGNQTRAAELLGMSRNGLAYKLRSLGLKS